MLRYVIRRSTSSAAAPSFASREFSSGSGPEHKVGILGAAGGIGQPLSLLMKLNPLVSNLSLYDVAGTPADVRHINTRSEATPKANLSDEEITALSKRTQDGGTEVVEAKAGKGPIAIKLRTYDSSWFSDSCYGKFLNEEIQMRSTLEQFHPAKGSTFGFRVAKTVFLHYPKTTHISCFIPKRPKPRSNARKLSQKKEELKIRSKISKDRRFKKRSNAPQPYTHLFQRQKSQVLPFCLLQHELCRKNQMQFDPLGVLKQLVTGGAQKRIGSGIGKESGEKHFTDLVKPFTSSSQSKGKERLRKFQNYPWKLMGKQKVQNLVHLIEHDQREELRKAIEMMIEIVLRERKSPYQFNAYLSKVRKLQALLASKTNTKTVTEWVQVPSNLKNASLIAQDVALQLGQKRSFRSIFRQIMQSIPKKGGIAGIRIMVAGRLNGAEIARSESAKVGRTSTTTINQRMDYATAEALTRYGIIGVKVWVLYTK